MYDEKEGVQNKSSEELGSVLITTIRKSMVLIFQFTVTVCGCKT